jgi:L-2-hydroxyglutarate oxidase
MNADVIIAGAGIVGLSTAYQIQSTNPDLKIIILEKENAVSTHQTGHNSGVMHSGIYYKPNSYKASNCIRGYQLLIEFCQQEHIPYQLIGKLIVATEEEQLPRLQRIYENGLENGLSKIKLLNSQQVKETEPNVSCLKAISVPYAGIVDYKLVAGKLYQRIHERGAQIKFSKKINAITELSTGIKINCADQSDYHCSFFINCTGLQSDRIARMSGMKTDFRIIPFKGNYYNLKDEKKDIVHQLIYPVPDPQFPFLGVHYTRLINGEQTLGPNAVLVLDREGYENGAFNYNDTKDILSFPGFWKLIGRHWKTGMGEYLRNYSKSHFAKKASIMTPGIKPDDLLPGHSGIRAQVVDTEGRMVEDFVCLRKNKMIHVCNAPSPAATAGLSIGKQISDWYFEMK